MEKDNKIVGLIDTGLPNPGCAFEGADLPYESLKSKNLQLKTLPASLFLRVSEVYDKR